MATAARLLPSETQSEDVVILAARPRARGPASRDTRPRYHVLVVEGEILRIAPIEGFFVSDVRVVQRETVDHTNVPMTIVHATRENFLESINAGGVRPGGNLPGSRN